MSTNPTVMTPDEVMAALYRIATEIADGYAARLAALPAESKTERKALTIQREMATLYIRTIIPGYGKTPLNGLLTFMDRRLRQLTAVHSPAIRTAYEAATEADRRVMLPYLLGLCFEESQFLRPWRAELATAEAAGDVVAAFELKLKLATVTQVLRAGADFWQTESAAGHLPALPPMEELLHE